MATQTPSCPLFLRCDQNTGAGRAGADRYRAWSRQLKDKKGGSHYYKTDKKETERNNEKTEGWNKARKNDEQFAFVLGRKRRAGVRMHMVMKGARK